MNAQCAKCGTQIRVDESKLGERGAKIRCPRCGNTVIVERTSAASAAAFDASALDPSVVGGGPASGAALPEPEMLGDEDLLFADADLLSQADSGKAKLPAPTRGASRSGPKSSTWNVETRVGVVPPIVKDRHAPAADPDEALLAGGLAADGTFTPPMQPRTGATSGAFDSPQTVTRAIDLKGPLAQKLAESGASPRPTRLSPPAPQRSALTVLGAIVSSLLAVALLGFGLVLFLGGGRFDARLLRFDTAALAAVWSPRPVVALDDLRVVAMRSVLYPTRSGAQVLVFFGEVHNAGTSARERVVVRAELRDAAGRLVASARAPLGAALGPSELYETDQPARLAALYEAHAATKVAPASVAPFTVVFTAPPPLVERLQHAVTLAYDPAPAMTPAAVEPEPPPAKARLKGKGKGKGKARQREGGDD